MSIGLRHAKARPATFGWRRTLPAGALVVSSLVGACGGSDAGAAAAGRRVWDARAWPARALTLAKEPAQSRSLDPAARGSRAIKECAAVPCADEPSAMAATPGHGTAIVAGLGKLGRGPAAVGELPAVTVEARRAGQCRKPPDRLATLLFEPVEPLC